MKCHKMLCVHCAYIVWIEYWLKNPLCATESQTSGDMVYQISLYISKNVLDTNLLQ